MAIAVFAAAVAGSVVAGFLVGFGLEESAGQMELSGEQGYDYRYVVMPMRV